MRGATAVVIACCVLALLTTSASAVTDYTWSLSGSSTDPNQNTGTPVSGAPVTIYLWLSAVNPALGAAAMECQIVHTGYPFLAGAFTALNGALATGAPDLLLAIPCATTPTLLGSQAYFDGGAGGTVCMAPSIANAKSVTVDCAQVGAQERLHTVNGFSSTAAAPCLVDPSPVTATTWGGVKSLYR